MFGGDLVLKRLSYSLKIKYIESNPSWTHPLRQGGSDFSGVVLLQVIFFLKLFLLLLYNKFISSLKL